MKELTSYSTRALLNELKGRAGVEPALFVHPQENYEIHLHNRVISDIGPAILLRIID